MTAVALFSALCVWLVSASWVVRFAKALPVPHVREIGIQFSLGTQVAVRKGDALLLVALPDEKLKVRHQYLCIGHERPDGEVTDLDCKESLSLPVPYLLAHPPSEVIWPWLSQ